MEIFVQNKHSTIGIGANINANLVLMLEENRDFYRFDSVGMTDRIAARLNSTRAH